MLDLERDVSGAVFDALTFGVIALDGKGRVIGWNEWLTSASGIPAKNALGSRPEEIFGTPGARVLASAVAAALELGTTRLLTHALHPGLLPLKTRAGQELIHDVSVQAIAGQAQTRCLVQITDVTVHAQRERVLRERQNARYDAVVETAPDAILTLDSRSIIRLANPAAARAFGYGPNELLGEPIASLIGEQKPWDEAWKAVVSGEPLTRPVEIAIRRKDGSRTFVEASASRWLSESRVFVTTILHDVSERRAAEDALRNLNQELERRVEARTAERDRMWRLSTDVMMVARLDGIIEAVNPAWTQLFGWTDDKVIGSSVKDFIDPEDRPPFAAVLDALSNSGAAKLFELSLRTRDGGMRRVEWSAVAAGGLLHAVGRDVTAERQREKALRNAEEALRQSQKMEAIGQLTGGIAHDFNNLLTGIIGSLDAVKRRIATGRYADTERFMDAAVTSANRAAALTHRLLAFARRQPLDPKAVDVNHLIRGMEDLLRRTLGEQVQLTTDLATELWPAFTDANQLENALLNLVINARDAMPKGGLLVITTANVEISEPMRDQQDEIAPGEYTVVAVRDTGSGIAPDVLPKIFEPFFTTKPAGQGTGLGLSMIYGFVKQSHGHLRIETALGKGTSVRLYLPRYRGPLAVETAERNEHVPTGAGETVLLVEDDSSVRLLVADVLRDLGYACVEASDAHSALPILASSARLDLLISDVGLPGLNGRQLAEIARRHRPDLKVLFVTGYAEHATGHRPFLDEGMQMVTKPFVLDALAQRIRQMIAG